MFSQRKSKAGLISAFVMAAALLCGTSSARAGDDNWRFSITPYLWLPSIDAKLGVDAVPVDFGTNTSASDMFGKLDFALLVAGEVRKDKIGLFCDFQTVKISDEATLRRSIGNGYHYEMAFADATVAPEFRLIDQPKFSLDALAGARVIYAETSVGINATAVTGELKADQSKVWVDPIVGAKCSYRINDKWALHAYGDIGGFGAASNVTYQLIGTVSYSFNEHVALQVGYRVFVDSFDSGGFKFDPRIYGPVAGLTFSF